MEKCITVELSGSRKDSFIIRDDVGITIGRFNIVAFEEDNKYILLRLKFYKPDNNRFLEVSLSLLIKELKKSGKVHKLSIMCDNDIYLNPFTNLGFSIEGYIEENVHIDKDYKDSILFGYDIDYNTNVYDNKDYIKKGKNIAIRILTPKDAPQLLQYYIDNRKHLASFEPYREESFYTVEVQKQSLIENYRQFFKGEGAHFGIYLDKKLIGRIRISSVVNGVFKSCFIGYSIDEAYQGKGYMKEAVNLVCEYAFEDMDLHRVEASTLTDNERSKGVLRACGFEEMGVSRKYLFINGKWRDHNIFYKVKE